MAFTLAVAGKGGIGKTTLATLLIETLIERGDKPVLAVDADPNPNLHLALGFPSAPPALVGMKDLIEERLGSLEGFFRLNPRVDDIPDRFSYEDHGVRLLVMGGIGQGGGGCACSRWKRSTMQRDRRNRSEVRFVHGQATVLPGRGYRQAGGVRHRE
jgi:CO dehydrogenase maturation factor